jgi:hypothetical protein
VKLESTDTNEIEATEAETKEMDELGLSHDFGSAQIDMISLQSCRDLQ